MWKQGNGEDKTRDQPGSIVNQWVQQAADLSMAIIYDRRLCHLCAEIDYQSTPENLCVHPK